MKLMGVDVGTTGVKALVFTPDGRQSSGAYREYDLIPVRDGSFELDSSIVVKKTFEAISEAAYDAGSGSVKALAVSSQGEAVTPLDKNGKPLARSIISFDPRTRDIAPFWEEALGRRKIFSITGMPLHAMYTVLKIMWWRKHCPKVFHSARLFLCYQDLVNYRLTGIPAIDPSLAARTMGLDVKKREWSGIILDKAGIDEKLLAEVVPSGETIGKVKPSVASRLNLAHDAVVVSGGHDQPCGALGAGVIDRYDAMYATGTVECITPCLGSKPAFTKDMLDNNFCIYPHVVPKQFVTIAFNFTGGNLLKWYRDTFGNDQVQAARKKNMDPYEVILSDLPRDPTGILVLPHFTTTGTPHFDTDPTSAIVGLKLTTSRSDFIKALLEGVTYEMRHNVELMGQAAGFTIKRLKAIGGGARSAAWMQIKADLMGMEVTGMKNSEAAACGAAMLAGVGLKLFTERGAAKVFALPEKKYKPDKKRSKIYNGLFKEYTGLYPAIRKWRSQGKAI